jgi:hypothetical protein
MPLVGVHEAGTGTDFITGKAVDRSLSENLLKVNGGFLFAAGPYASSARLAASSAPAPARAGVPRITEKGITRIEQHLSRPGLEDAFGRPALQDPANARMIQRLRSGQTTQQDINFYMHELKESAIMNRGVGARDAHLQTLEWQKIPYTRGYESQLYAPDAAALFNSP